MIARMYWQRGVSLDAQQLLDRQVPGDVVGHRRDVVHPVGDRHVLVVVEVLAELLEAGVQVADVGHGVDDPLAVELQHQPQRGVRGRVLRAEVHASTGTAAARLGELFDGLGFGVSGMVVISVPD